MADRVPYYPSMAHDPAISEVSVARVGPAGDCAREVDRVAVEAPLELRLEGRPATVIMRTPGADEDLARGFLFGEGLVSAADELRGLRRPGGLKPAELGNVLEIELAPSLVRRRPSERSMYASSSCGVCGVVSIDALEVRAPRIDAPLRVARPVLASLPERLRAAQEVFSATGGLHAAGAFAADGGLLCLREDVGRHNAVDKLVGWALAAGRLPLADAALCVSGRLSYEIVQKAVVAGFPVVAAVSAPSSLAVELAERFGVTLCGFVRGGRLNVYAHPARIGL
jgi:FdhD protein